MLILGAGGATRGVILPLIDAGVARLSTNRTTLRAVGLVNDMQDLLGEAELKAIGLEQPQGNVDIIINATSASLSGEALLLPETLIFSHAYEMAYGKPSSFWIRQPSVAYLLAMVLVCWSVRRLRRFQSGMA